MAFLQTFKKRDRSKLIHARYFPFDNQTRSILYTFACTFFLFCLEEEREKEREIIPTNKRERKKNKRVSKQSDVTRSSNVTSASRDHLPLLGVLRLLGRDSIKRLHCQSVQSSRCGERELSVFYI